MSIRIFSDIRTASYEAPGHPEALFRVSASIERLKAAGLAPFTPPIQATEDDVLSIHTLEHWKSVQEGTFQDPDTPYFEGIDEIALISLSGTLSALDSAVKGVPGFSLMRPPGHHAGRERVAGFCYLNNVAIACHKVLGTGHKVATLDIDVHHGDGTESIAYGNDSWLFISLHQAPLYPGSGLQSRRNCINVPLPPFTKEKEYLIKLEEALHKIMEFEPQMLAVSAGFDTYKECPLAQMKLERDTYFRIGKMIAETGIKRFAALEGGYAEELPLLIENFVTGFAG